MLTDGIFDLRTIEIPAKVNQTINIIVLGDIHFNSDNFADSRFDADIKSFEELSKREPVHFILLGDAFEALSTSERKYFAGGSFHNSTELRWETEYAREIDNFVKRTQVLKDRTLAVFGGNHFFMFQNGTTSDMALASKLNATYVGCSGYIVLVLRYDKKHSNVVKFFLHHGKGSGKRVSSSLTGPEDALSYFRDADIVIMGHDHQAVAARVPALEVDRGMGDCWRIVDKNRIIGRAGSYLRAYVPGSPSYAVDKMLRPSTIGYLCIQLTPKRNTYHNKTYDRRWVDLNVRL